jgi:transcriptional regulator GlxA family with amidase domain
MRMEVACALLKSTPLLIGDIALAVGYSAVASFSTAFRKHTGVPPREYRTVRN